MKNIIQTTLANHIKYDQNNQLTFDVQEFYTDWFQKQGRAYTFVFKANLATTNMQYAEIFPLIRQFTETKGRTTQKAPNVLFHSSTDFKRSLNEITQPYLENAKILEDINWESFLEAYGSTLAYSMVADARFGTFSLNVPPTLSVAISQVCAQSGYIDSCGLQIYVREVSKGSASDLVKAIKDYLKFRKKKSSDMHQNELVKFEIWSHEHSQRTKNPDTALNGLRLYADKVRLGTNKVSNLVEDFILKDELLKKEIALEGENLDGTIWVVQDRNTITNGLPHPGSKRYLICYHQIFKNCNPLHYFDENKPAWIAPITMPHMLLGAMINLTRPWNDTIRIHDPFCGTGSLVLEMLKDHQAHASGGDLSLMTPLLAQDNIEFMKLEFDQLRKFSLALVKISASSIENIVIDLDKSSLEKLKQQETKIIKKSPDIDSKIVKYFCEAFEASTTLKFAIQNLDKPPADYEYDQTFLESLRSKHLLSRLFFYTILRTEVRFKESARSSTNWWEVFSKKSKELSDQLEAFAIWKLRDRTITRGRPRMPPNLNGCRNYDTGYYEVGLHPSVFDQIDTDYIETKIICISAEDKWNQTTDDDNSYDCIVTDPPYGFNTDENTPALASLYYRFLRKWICKLKANGHLVLCLPQESYNGQPLPYCTNPQIVTSQILTIAAELNRTAFVPARSLASNSPGSSPPYYWESAKVLRRTILHFQFSGSSIY